jgi:hypothetical protein
MAIKSRIVFLKMAKGLILGVLFALAIAGSSWAEVTPENTTSGTDNKAKKDFGVKTVEGLRFAVPEDMPIQKKDGITAPMKMEEYVAVKFSRIENRLSAVEKAIAKINEELSTIENYLGSLKKPSALISDAQQDISPALKDLKE